MRSNADVDPMEAAEERTNAGREASRRIAELESELAAARAEARTDALTGLANRRGWDEALAGEDARCKRHGLDAQVIAVDVDFLKAANARGGHAAGDALLRRCANALCAVVRASDTVARVGGDEFAILAVHAGGSTVALQRRLSQAFADEGVEATTGASALSEGGSLADAWERADRRMLAAKGRRHEHGNPGDAASA
jgi:diguanylate cyclase (GGDEF)-like protein